MQQLGLFPTRFRTDLVTPTADPDMDIRYSQGPGLWSTLVLGGAFVKKS